MNTRPRLLLRDEKARIEAVERAVQELIKQEEHEKTSKKSFNGPDSGTGKGYCP
jgi:hypothetical protein